MMGATRVLVVEDEAIIAMSIEDALAYEGYEVIGPAGSVETALSLLKYSAPVNVALLDVNLRGETVYPVAEELAGRSIPFAFTSGYGEEGIDSRFADRLVIPKPVDEARLIRFVQDVMRGK